MRILFVSEELIAGSIAFLLKNEGCDVKLFINKRNQRKNFENLLPKVDAWEKEISWVGKDGLIIFDDVGFGAIQTKLRAQGYSVFGGSELGDKLEEDRQWAQEILKTHGLKTLPTFNFANFNEAIEFAKHNLGPWVIKQNGFEPYDMNFIGEFEDNRDVLSVLRNYKKYYKNSGIITLQRRAYGVEIGVGRYFNGLDWVGPIEINREHKKFFPGDLGPSTSEMGTIAWYDEDENNLLFQATLAKLKPFLQKIDYRGDIDLNCIVNSHGVYTLEITPRLGTPIIHLHSEIHSSLWHIFLKAVADRQPYKLKWKKGIGIVLLLTTPPFPFATNYTGNLPTGLEIFFDDKITKNDLRHIHFEGISMRKSGGSNKNYYISDPEGYVMYVTALGKTIGAARKKVQNLIKKIHFPKMYYRNDIGVAFEIEMTKLINAGYISHP